MTGKVPHIVQYQGSKRILAPQILQYMPDKFDRLVEPFAGMAAITIAVAQEKRADRYLINDINEPLINMLKMAIEEPEELIDKYTKVWQEQFSYGEEHINHFNIIRDRFNNGEKNEENMLYLIARCVKGAVRYGSNGNFNQSADKRRHGTSPKTLKSNIQSISNMLKGRVDFFSEDYHTIFDMVEPGDLLYMDPPYQGVTNVRDNRYYAGVPFEEFVLALETLNKKGIDYLISYDGECGGKEYGEELPIELGCKKILLNAGLSSQATLLGKKQTTFEALYISRNLIKYCDTIPQQMTMEIAI